MNDKKDIHNETLIECAICLKEVPESEAKMSEAQDYFQNFCGLDCYKQWQEQNKEAKGDD